MRVLIACALAALVLPNVVPGGVSGQATPPDITLFFETARADERQATKALRQIAAAWRDGYTPMLVDIMRFLRTGSRSTTRTAETAGSDSRAREEPDPEIDPRAVRSELDLLTGSPFDVSGRPRQRLVEFLTQRTGRRFGDDLTRWRQWMWTLPYEPHPDYARFKGALYSNVDPRMQRFFASGVRPRIRLDEIDWGGVRVNGIPPLDHPKVIPASQASYLKDAHVVFGIVLNGESRAYPKRILAWHEMARDRVGGVELTIVYCTLCGTVIPYESRVGGQHRIFGTSGLLYRSNKLMFDEESWSLWSTFEGKPVVGPLAETNLQLTFHPVVTTTWGEWKAEHPQTSVLSLETGYTRDYGEGAAYRDYFATDQLMFQVPRTDARLKNKAEVLALALTPREGGDRRALAISASFLKKNPVFHTMFAGRRLVVVTTPGGANRVYESSEVRLVSLADGKRVKDERGGIWRVTEEALVSDEPSSMRLPRVPSYRAFWFGWVAQFPDTELIK